MRRAEASPRRRAWPQVSGPPRAWRRRRQVAGAAPGASAASAWPRGCRQGCERRRGARLRPLGRTGHPAVPWGAPGAPRAAAGPTTCGATASAARPAPPVVGGAVAAPRTTATTTNAGARATAATERRRLVARPRRALRQAMNAGTIATRHNSRPTPAVAGITARSARSRTMTNPRYQAVARTLRGISLHYRPPLAVGRCDRSSSAGWRALPLCASRDEARGR